MTMSTMEQDKGACLVVGAAGGVGRALAPMLHAAGWRLILAGRSEPGLRDVAATIPGEVEVFDARDFEAVANVFDRHEGISAAVNLAGSILLKPAHGTNEAEFEETIGLNLRTSFALVRAAGRAMRRAGGSVVLMSTCAASVGLPNHEAIAAAKAGVEGLARSAAATYASCGIRFNAVAPGLVDTPLSARVTGNEAALKASTAMHPLGRIGAAEEVARAIAFLLDPSNGWITGQVLGVDGGLSRARSRPGAGG
jgi:NAD(P)-dependent dehydrogenase (short-subunit alcohol dehydrogenase family)